MSKNKSDLLAGEYVLGTLDAEDRARFAAQLSSDPALQQQVEAWERRLEGLESSTAPVEPPVGLWDKIEAALDAAVAPVTLRAGQGGWQQILEGVEKKVLHQDPEAGVESYLLRLAPGARLPAHEHRLTEECIMLEGEAWIGELKLVAGDFHLAPAGSTHPETHSETGALAYIRGEVYDLAS
jgi:anti-sigma factor ChrR (cupin superfamily)